MTTSAFSEITNPVDEPAQAIVKTVLGHLRRRAFAVQLWNGEQWGSEPAGAAGFKLIFRTPDAVRSVFSEPSALSFGEAYIHGDLDLEGSLLDAFDAGDEILAIHFSPRKKLHLRRWLWSIPAARYSRSGVFSGFVER